MGVLFLKFMAFLKMEIFLMKHLRKRNGVIYLTCLKSKSILAKEIKVDLDELNKIIECSRKKLFEKRKERIHPLKDDKILTDWNGLMIASLAQGGMY